MQTSMGQTATTLNSLLDMNSEEADGESVEAQLLQSRIQLIDAVRSGADCSAPLQKLVQLKCPVSLKYAQLNVSQLLKDNNESVAQLKTIPVALGMLEKYGRHLLKPPGARVDQWRQIKFNNAIFKDRVLPMQGAVEVVQQMGYSDPADFGLQFSRVEPDADATSNLVADILLARMEMDSYLMGKHPHPETIHALLPEPTVDAVLVLWDQVLGAEAGTVSINPLPTSTQQQVPQHPTPMSTPVQAETGLAVQEPSRPQPQATESEGEHVVSTLNSSDDSLPRACDICGDAAAMRWCRLCDNKQLCTDCDEMWHKHPKRQNHNREPISSLPSPSSIPGADAIMGPFGIRAVHSLSSQSRDLDRSPTPVSGSQAGVHRDASRTPPPQQRQPTPPPLPSQPLQQQQQPVSPRSSLQQHQQQLQFYLQQQEQLLQQEKGFSQTNENSFPLGQFSHGTVASQSNAMPQDIWLNSSLNSRHGNETQLMTASIHNTALPRFQNTNLMAPTSQLRLGDGAEAVHPSQQQRAAGLFPQPDYSLRGPQQSTGVGSATSAGDRDLSLRQPERDDSPRVFPAELDTLAAASESKSQGQAPCRTSSISAGAASMSESSLLKTVLAESDYEKRAAKCDVRLLTLDEDLEEVNAKLNHLMLNTADVSECPDFMTLNRHKARLMKEHQALSNYKQELAQLMAAEPPHSSRSSSDSTHIYHPPPLPSSPYPSHPSPQVSAVPVFPKQQPRFSHPQQASLSPPHTVSVSANQQPGAVQGKPAQVSYYSPYAQESMAHNPVASPNSSVDRSSILPQWQMNPASPSMPQPPVSHRNQSLGHPTSMYQYGNVSNNASTSPLYVSPTEGIHRQSTSAGQGRAPASVSHQFSGPYSPGSYGYVETGGQDFNQLGLSPVNPFDADPTIMQGAGGRIGFENLMPEEPPMPFHENASSLQLKPVQPQPPQSPYPSQPKPLQPQPSQTFQPEPQVQSVSVCSYSLPMRHIPPPASQAKYEQLWQCTHCTYINPPNTRVCSMCDRTSDNPLLIHPEVVSQGEAVTPGDSGAYGVVFMSEEQKESVTAMAVPQALNVNREQLAKIHNRIAEEQDQVFLEKKEAKEQYSRQQASLNQIQTSSGPPSGPPPPLPINTPTSPPKPPVPSRQHLSVTEAVSQQPPDKVSPTHVSKSQPIQATTTAAPQTLQYSHQPAFTSNQPITATATTSGLSETQSLANSVATGDNSVATGDNSVAPGDNSGLGSIDSVSSFVKEGDFSSSMERFSQQKKIKQLQMDGADLMYFIKMADKAGFQVGEMQVAIAKYKDNYRDALEWLHSEWSKLLQVVISSARAEGQRSDQNDVGDVSAEEARKALQESKGELVPAVKNCVAKRKKLYAYLNKNGGFAREEVLQAMLQNEGDDEAAREQLNCAMLKPFLDRVWEDEEGDVATATRTLLQMTMAESTCQSVSTSVISKASFQQTIMDTSVDRDRRVRMILVEGKLKSWGRADMVIKLLDVDLPAAYPTAEGEEPPYTLEDVVEAVRNCRDRQSARAYLTQECSTCFSYYPMSKIRNLNFCQCKICSDCLKQNFEVVIREKHVRHWTCPICGLPDLNDVDTASEYLSFLQLLLKTQVEQEVYELFETRVRDWHLQKDPNFRWCAHCGNGFIADENHLRMACPHCGDKTCYKCKRQWEEQHEGLTCEQFAQWKIDNDPNNQAVGLARHLEENGIDCPSCKMRYALAKGGCMHFKCPQCGHEFCSGCYQPFYQRGMCSRLQSCKSAGLHAHHPRDCFFYLRDESVEWLQNLLKESRVPFNTVPPESQEDAAHCPVIEQKEFDSGKCDESCGKDTQEGHAGLCSTHYKEYLVGLINKNNIDPVTAMTLQELQNLLKRTEIPCPKTSNKETETSYRKRIVKFVKDKSPLPRRQP